MAKYNKKQTTQTVINNQGGTAFKQEDKIALVSLLATGLDKNYYEKEDERENRLIDLMDKIAKKDKFFLAQAIVYARSVMGQRTITHRAAVHLASLLNGEEWGKNFFTKRSRKNNEGGIIYRLDDLTEIAACYFHFNENKPLSNPIKKGFKSALENADAYEMAKYQSKNSNVSLVDIVNLVHPKSNDKNKEALNSLVNGTLKQFNTVEDKNTKAGQDVKKLIDSGEISKEEATKVIKEKKAENFKELITTKKIGYLALLRNLRNIILDAPELIDQAGKLLTTPSFVKKSLVFPHQIDLAFEVVMDISNNKDVRKMASYIDKAYELAVGNLSELMDGNTAVVVDTSGSMFSTWKTLTINGQRANGRNRTPIEKAALVGATFAKGLQADLYQFASYCQSIKYNPMDSINTIKNTILNEQGHVGHGTSFQTIFRALNDRYDRIIVISDLQGSDNLVGNSSTLTEYKRSYNVDPYIYSVDMCGYGTTMFKQNNKLFQLAGYSKDIYENAKKYEIDPKALINEIKKIVI